MAVTSVQCSLSLSEHPHPLHLHLSTFPSISPLFICTLLLCILHANLYLFLCLSALPCLFLHVRPPSSIRRLHQWLLQRACDSDRSHHIITAHPLYSIPSSVSDYTWVHGSTYSLNTKARNLSGVATVHDGTAKVPVQNTNTPNVFITYSLATDGYNVLCLKLRTWCGLWKD